MSVFSGDSVKEGVDPNAKLTTEQQAAAIKAADDVKKVVVGEAHGGLVTDRHGYALGGLPYGAEMPTKAEGGGITDDLVPIVAAGGEYVITPEQVASIGKGDLDHGHKILDAFVKKTRAKTIDTLKKLPGPKKD